LQAGVVDPGVRVVGGQETGRDVRARVQAKVDHGRKGRQVDLIGGLDNLFDRRLAGSDDDRVAALEPSAVVILDANPLERHAHGFGAALPASEQVHDERTRRPPTVGVDHVREHEHGQLAQRLELPDQGRDLLVGADRLLDSNHLLGMARLELIQVGVKVEGRRTRDDLHEWDATRRSGRLCPPAGVRAAR
jgi:hypothetical protein